MNLSAALSSAFGLLLVFAGYSHATTLLSENFDELSVGLAVTSVGAFSAIDGTNVDIVGPGEFGYLCVAPESGNCVDMDGSNGDPQGVLQSNSSFLLSPGTKYYLSFDLIGSQRGNTTSTTVDFGPYSKTFKLASSDVTSGIVVDQMITVMTVGIYYLDFTSNTPGNVGALLDNVLLTTVPAIAPEPASFFLAVPVLLIGYTLRRRLR